MINLVDEIVSRHTEAEIIEYLYREMQTVDRRYDSVVGDAQDATLLYTQEDRIGLVTDILKALHKRNQARQVQADVI